MNRIKSRMRKKANFDNILKKVINNFTCEIVGYSYEAYEDSDKDGEGKRVINTDANYLNDSFSFSLEQSDRLYERIVDSIKSKEDISENDIIAFDNALIISYEAEDEYDNLVRTNRSIKEIEDMGEQAYSVYIRIEIYINGVRLRTTDLVDLGFDE